MNKSEFLLKYGIHPIRYQKKNKVDIITTNDNKYRSEEHTSELQSP